MQLSLEGDTAIVTGAASGIGRGIATCMADAGANVVVADIRRAPKEAPQVQSTDPSPTDELVAERGGESLFVETDVSDTDDVESLIGATVDAFGGVDVLVNNAGIDPDVSIRTISVEEWREVVSVDLDGAFYCTRQAVDHLVDADGAIVNIASVMGTAGGGGPPYASAKAGLINLTRDLAVELGPERVNVNCVCPGYIKTAIQDENDRANVERARRRTLLPRLGEPTDIGRVVTFLASDAAEFVHGAVVDVDGGWSAHRG